MGKIVNFILGAMAGGMIGAVTALLLTPKSGQALRGDFAEYTENVKHEVRRAAQQRRMELSTELEQLREPVKRIDE